MIEFNNLSQQDRQEIIACFLNEDVPECTIQGTKYAIKKVTVQTIGTATTEAFINLTANDSQTNALKYQMTISYTEWRKMKTSVRTLMSI